jgi:hypothetical protein
MPNEPKTDSALLERLRQAATREISGKELREQRVSFVYGNLPKGITMTREQVRKRLEQKDGLPEVA